MLTKNLHEMGSEKGNVTIGRKSRRPASVPAFIGALVVSIVSFTLSMFVRPGDEMKRSD